MFTLSVTALAICCAGAFVGGFIDSIAGGGGLITLPALLIAGVPPHSALSANKFSACLGTCAALGAFSKSGLVQWRAALTGVPFSLLGSYFGAMLALSIDSAILSRVLVALLPPAMLLTLLPARRDDATAAEVAGPRLWLALPALCFAIGMYDGFYGPGTGSFLIIAFHWLLRMRLLAASATAKVLNLGSNVSGVVAFIATGNMFWAAGIPMAAACITGNWMGSRLAIRTGAGTVRRFLLLTLGLLFATLVWQYFLSPAK